MTLERLHARLRMLEPEDAEEINRMLAVLRWSSQFVEARDTAVVRRYGELMQEITNPLVREVLAAGMDMRMVLSALRRRRHGLGPPTVGFGRWFEHIRHHQRARLRTRPRPSLAHSVQSDHGTHDASCRVGCATLPRQTICPCS